MNYHSILWHRNADGEIYDITVEYEKTFWQHIFRQKRTVKRWRKGKTIEWYRVLDNNTLKPIDSPKEIREFLSILRSTERYDF